MTNYAQYDCRRKSLEGNGGDRPRSNACMSLELGFVFRLPLQVRRYAELAEGSLRACCGVDDATLDAARWERVYAVAFFCSSSRKPDLVWFLAFKERNFVSHSRSSQRGGDPLICGLLRLFFTVRFTPYEHARTLVQTQSGQLHHVESRITATIRGRF